MNIRAIAKGQRGLLSLAIILGILGAVASLAQPLLIGELIAGVASGGSLVQPIAFVIALFVTDALLTGLQAYLVGRAGENIVFDIRRTLTSRLLRASMSAFRRLEHGDAFTRAVTDTALARIALSDSLAQIIISGFMVIGGIVLMGWIDTSLLLVTLACLGSASLVSLLLARRLRKAALTHRRETSSFGSGLQRAMVAITTVKASLAEQREEDSISERARRAQRSGVHVSALTALLTPAMNVGTQVCLAAVIGFGMARVASGTMEASNLTAFVMYLFYLVSPLVTLFMALGRFQQGRAAIERVTQLGKIEQEPVGSSKRPQIEADIAVEFGHVTFGYKADTEAVLDDVSFTVPKRGLTAIVGPSGAGKTTIFQLIMRFYHPIKGTVRVTGADVEGISIEHLRSAVGYVEQEATLLRGTIRENLIYANPRATEAEMTSVLRAAHLSDVIAALPEGLETDLGEQGVGLSGGQKQRLAIARSLLLHPRVLLLDEATAHLDAHAEAALRRTIAEVSRHCSVIIITHRLDTISDADHIVFLEGGKARAQGPHADLMESDERYRKLVIEHLSISGRDPQQLAG
ncbi:ABC transporter ATP-binding protein [Nonomuraea sp. NPDC005650]|uniref:ABC transporter ATP-binding protein n=1 Tax=Nonomuraea sp. NPDC005650 TaxID=3157045 RepID=UPI0033B5E32A